MFFWTNWARPAAKDGLGAFLNDPFSQHAFNNSFLRPAVSPMPVRVELSQPARPVQPQGLSFMDHAAIVVKSCVVPAVEVGLRLLAEEVKAQWRRESPGTLALWELGRKQAIEGNQKLGDAMCALAFCLWQNVRKNKSNN